MSNLFDIKMVFTQIPDLLTYLPVTLELAVVSMIVSLILGLILALIKMKKIPVLKQLANLYISVIRGTSGTGTVVCNILWNPDDLKSHQFEIWNEL